MLSQLQLVIAATCVVALGCEGDIRPPKSDPAGEPAPAGAPSGPATGGTAPAPTAPPRANDGDARMIGALSSRELIEVCQDSHANVARALAAQVQIDCIASSLGSGGAGCESARQKCMQDSMPDAEDDDEAACEVEAPMLAMDCASVSVSALRDCEEAWIRKLEAAGEQLDCDSSIDDVRRVTDSATPEECQKLDARCGAP